MTIAQINRQQGYEQGLVQRAEGRALPVDVVRSLRDDRSGDFFEQPEYWDGYAHALGIPTGPYERIDVGLAVPWYRSPLKALLQWWDEKLGEVMP